MAGDNDAHALLVAVINDVLGQLHALVLGEEEHLAGLADGENAGDLMRGVIVDDALHRSVVDLVILGERSNHYRPYAVCNFLHGISPCFV